MIQCQFCGGEMRDDHTCSRCGRLATVAPPVQKMIQCPHCHQMIALDLRGEKPLTPQELSDGVTEILGGPVDGNSEDSGG